MPESEGVNASPCTHDRSGINNSFFRENMRDIKGIYPNLLACGITYIVVADTLGNSFIYEGTPA